MNHGYSLPLDIHNYQDMLMKLRNRQTRFLNHGTANMVFALLRKTVSHYGHNVTSNGLKIQQALCRILGKLVIDLFSLLI